MDEYAGLAGTGRVMRTPTRSVSEDVVVSEFGIAERTRNGLGYLVFIHAPGFAILLLQ